jgi:hypothetical protein
LEDGEQQEEEYAYDPYEYIRHLPLRTYAQRILLPPLKLRVRTHTTHDTTHKIVTLPPPMAYARLTTRLCLSARLGSARLDQPTNLVASGSNGAPQKPTLVLDLDETLVHSTIEPPPPGSPPPGTHIIETAYAAARLVHLNLATDLPHCIPPLLLLLLSKTTSSR